MAGHQGHAVAQAGATRGAAYPAAKQDGPGASSGPFVSLSIVVKMTQVIGRRGGHCRFDDLAAALDQTKTSGAFRGRTSAGRIFGVVETVDGELHLTELGRRVCSPGTEAEALAEAFLNVPLYKALFARYAAEGGKLPTPDVIEADMERLGVSHDRAGVARQVFLRSAETAGDFRSGNDRLIRPVTGAGSIAGRHVGAPEPKEPAVVPPAEAAPMAEHPLIQGLMAKLPPEGERFTPRQRQRWLDAAKASLDLMYAGDDEDDPEPALPGPNGVTSRQPQRV